MAAGRYDMYLLRATMYVLYMSLPVILNSRKESPEKPSVDPDTCILVAFKRYDAFSHCS